MSLYNFVAIVQLLKSWEYKNKASMIQLIALIVQLLKSWEYKNQYHGLNTYWQIVQLLKSWEYKNLKFVNFDFCSLKNIIKS